MGWMGPVVNGQAHEVWVVPLFADGAQGAGTTSARGVLIARRPDDGPRDGDQVRLAYRDGCTVEGIWQDRTVIGGDGIMPAEPGGQVHCEMMRKRGVASGRRRGRLGRRLHLRLARRPLDPRPTGAGRPDGAAARRHRPVGRSGRRRRAPGDHRNGAATSPDGKPSKTSRKATAQHAAAARGLDEAVRTAVAAGASWADIGRATGMTGQSATERWSDRD